MKPFEFIDYARFNLCNDKEGAHGHTCVMQQPQLCSHFMSSVQGVSYSVLYYYANLSQRYFYFFSLSGTLMRGCIDGSSGKRLFMSGGLTNSDVNA